MQAIKVAWQSSPDAAIDRWKSPVLLIQGDDDRNVRFHPDRRSGARGFRRAMCPIEEMVIPNEIHGFLRHISWQRADTATVQFFGAQFMPAAK